MPSIIRVDGLVKEFRTAKRGPGLAGGLRTLFTRTQRVVRAVDGVSFLNHEGGGPGFTSEARIYPATGLGIVLCMNRWMMPTKTHLVAHRLCEIIRSRTPPRRS